jgi:hypothetical protein
LQPRDQVNGTQCKHERAQDGCFVKEKWDDYWFQGQAVNLPNLKVTFDGSTSSGLGAAAGAGATYKMAVEDTPHSLSTSVAHAYRTSGDSNSEDLVPIIAQADKTNGDTD